MKRRSLPAVLLVNQLSILSKHLFLFIAAFKFYGTKCTWVLVLKVSAITLSLSGSIKNQ